MSCDKCGSDAPCDEHHLWCKFLNNPHGNSFENFVSRVSLCKECHLGVNGIHKKIIVPILKSRSVKQDYDSEYCLWNYVPIGFKSQVITEIVVSSWLWLQKKGGDNDTQATAS